MRVGGNVGATDGAVAEEGFNEPVIDGGQGEMGGVVGGGSGELEQRAGRAVGGGDGVEECSPLGVAELAAGVERGLDDGVQISFAGEHQAGFDEQLQRACGEVCGGRLAGRLWGPGIHISR